MKWITIEDAGFSDSGKTRVWKVRVKDGVGIIGMVEWYAPWRRYVFAPSDQTVYEQDCLRDIAAFVEQATADHKKAKAKPA